MSRYFIIILSFIVILFSFYENNFAAVVIPGEDIIRQESIDVYIGPGGSIESAKDFGFRILSLMKIAISGVAIIWIVLIGVYMIIGSDNEEKIKTQRKQITYMLFAFLFFNIPSMIYTVFMPGASSATVTGPGDWSDTAGYDVFWYTAGFEGLLGNIIAFLRVFAFGGAVLMFTWGLFSLIMSAGDDEKKKMAKNRIVYGIIGLIFLGFIQMILSLVSAGNIASHIPSLGNSLFSLVMYIAAPITIFMLMYGAYYWITSAGDEERIKKGKSIIINTGIAVLILITGLSFIADLANFQL